MHAFSTACAQLCVILLLLCLSSPFRVGKNGISFTLVRRTAKKSKRSAPERLNVKGFGGKPRSTEEREEFALLRDDCSRELMGWMENNGASCRNVALANFDGLRGVVALADIQKGNNIIEVPYSAAIDLKSFGSDPTLAAIELLKVWSDPDSRWAKYLHSLPQPGSNELTTTDFFGEEELLMLQYPPVIDETRRRNEACKKLYNEVIQLQVRLGAAFHGRNVSMDEFKWAVFVVVSRVLTVVRGDGVSFAKLLIPGIDMFNHSAKSPHILTGRAADGSALRVVAGENVKAGTQIFIPYSGGSPRSDRFIQDYGFLDLEGCAEQDKKLMNSAEGRRHVEALRETDLEFDRALLSTGMLNAKEKLAVQFRAALKAHLAGS